uniref:ABC transporter domain-containing protein n=1 Tax=Physcomitrium patens TaxID=3218 RepID=A0A2K1K7M8_PHYPA|nr:hypothetical protein PHYPA_011675 [Physcomitrium patens]
MTEPLRKPKVPRRKEFKESFKLLEKEAQALRETRLEPFVASPDFKGSSQTLLSSPEAVGINGLSSRVTEGRYSDPGSSGPPQRTSRRSAFEEQLKNSDMFVVSPEGSHKVIEVARTSQDADKPSQKLYLHFSDLTYTVCKKQSRWQRFQGMFLPGLKQPAPKPLRLLDGISGEAKGGEILAVMGPSGSGKSTLIDALAQRIDAVTGSMTLNGNQFSERLLRNISAYVMQDDLLYPMLTVKETLLFAAFFRLPPSQSKAVKKARVSNLLNQLGLLRVANTIIGDEGHRGVSGGERRRVSIGIDIIHDPLILFLDEPTSGLDSTSAYLVVRTLQSIAKTGSLVVLSIHQPSYRIMGLFDRLIILAFGQKIFGGSPKDLNQYFEQFGRPVPKHENCTEHALDLIQELHGSKDGIKQLVEFRIIWEEKSNPSVSIVESSEVSASISGVLLNNELLSTNQSNETSTMEEKAWRLKMNSDMEFANPCWAEIMVLVRRSLKNINRTPELFLLRLSTVMVTGFILATIFWHLDHSPLGVQVFLQLDPSPVS